MKKVLLCALILMTSLPLRAWWDPGHFITAMIAYQNLNESARDRVDALTEVLERDYPQVNHFIATGPWPDDLKADGLRTYNTWHYTNIPYNPDNMPIPPQPDIDVIWAIGQCQSVLASDKAKDVDKARHLAFLAHFVSDLHQPMHSTSMFSEDFPAGTRGGNEFELSGQWRNLHMLWDDGCGYLSDYNDIRPYGQPKAPLTQENIERLRRLANEITNAYPKSELENAGRLDPDFWALESHKLAVSYGYRAINTQHEEGRSQYLQPGDKPSETYLARSREVVKRRLALSGYRLAEILNALFGSD